MTRLNQIVAIEKSNSSQAQRDWTDAHHRLQKAPLLSGISRTYRPKDDEGEQLPPESTRVQVNAEETLNDLHETLSRMFNVVATKDKANTQATADIKLEDGTIVARDVPVPFLLYLEKRLTDFLTFVRKLPTLDPSETWTWDNNSNCYATKPVETHRSKKVPRVLIKSPATDRHPAQTEVYYEDIVVGFWSTVKFSGALTATRVAVLADRVEALQKAVKFAREEANTLEITDFPVGDFIMDYLFA